MERIKICISSGIFLILTLIKLASPAAAADIRRGADEILGHDTDLRPVFEYIDETLSGLGGEKTAESNVQTLKAIERETAKVVFPVERNEITSLPDEAVVSGEAETEKRLPAAVEAFLQSQSKFSDYAVPANVSYSYEALPFEYSVPVGGYESSGFGFRLHPIHGVVKFHYGTDIAAWCGEKIYAFAEGTVVSASYSDGYGYYLVIDHGEGWQSLYAHCSALYVNSGDYVKMGENVALVGSTGLATGPHLHFELTQNGVYFNPEYYINDAV